MSFLLIHFAVFILGCQGLLFDDLLALFSTTTSTTTTTIPNPAQIFVDRVSTTKDCPVHLPRNKTLIFNPISHKCYQFKTSRKSWKAAEEECDLLGGKLAEIKDTQNDAFLNIMATIALGMSHVDRYMWIGAHDTSYSGQYHWKSGAPVHYARWDTGFPLSGMCVTINRETAHWETHKCTNEYQSLCQFEKDAVPKSTTMQSTRKTTHLNPTTTQQTKETENSGECPFCSNETDIHKCQATKNCPKGSEACYLEFTKDGATAGCSSDIIKCYQQKKHNTPECNYRPIPFEAHPNTTCSYCCDITMHSCFTDMLRFSVYAPGQK